MAKQQPKGGNGNNSNSNNGKGSTKNIGGTGGAAGRERKKNAQKLRNAAAAALRASQEAAHQLEIDRAFENASKEYGRLVDGYQGDYGFKSEAGIVVVRVSGKSIFVVASTVRNIAADAKKFIPVAQLRFESLQQVTPDDIFAWQVAVHAFLRTYVAPFMVKRIDGLGKEWCAANPDPVPVQAVEEPKKKVAVPLIDVTGAVPISAVAFMGVKKGQTFLFAHEENGAAAYFRTEVVAGNQAIALVKVEANHSLYGLMTEGMVRVHLSELSQAAKPYDSSLPDMKSRREHLRAFLRGVATGFGLKAKSKAVDTTTVAVTG